MGLGKTATAIALCTCVLRHRRKECRKAVVVCPSSLVGNWANEFRKWCPLGGGAVAVDQAGAAAAQLVSDFRIGAAARYPILVISYELYRNNGEVINATEGLGLLIADEGHRLKNSAETKTTRALKACPAVMRLVLTGTPMQNDLDEFFAVADFVNPGLLGSLKSFRSRYTRPITAAWDREADENVARLSAERSRELGEITEKFVLRRTKDVIRGSLPPALEVVIFCRPSSRQLCLYESCIASSAGARSLLYGDADLGGAQGGGSEDEEDEEGSDDGEEGSGYGIGAQQQQQQQPVPVGLRGVLPLISKLRRVCNHPDLVSDVGSGSGAIVRQTAKDDCLQRGEPHDGSGSSGKENSNNLAAGAAHIVVGAARRAGSKGSWRVPRASSAAAAGTHGVGAAGAGGTALSKASESAAPRYETGASGKVVVLEALLKAVRREYPGDKVVVTSNFTSALHVLEELAERNAWGSLRLDGGSPTNVRQSLVDRFNKTPPEDLFLFFLSAKAGGVGLNLVGANRIVLFDSDWNPATDDQAMARVWRLGQTKEVSMYRLLSTGTLEESIFQRQIFKGALYDLIHDSNDPSRESDRSRTIGGVTGSRQPQQERRGAAAAASGKQGGGQSNRSFSQEELKDLFVLKRDTRSDTYDKLRRGRVAAAAATTSSAVEQEGGRSQETAADQGLGVRCRQGEGCGGEDGNGATAAPVAIEEVWKDYGGPSEVLDSVLRLALLGKKTGTGGDDGDARNSRTEASGVVTFVREVKRGGQPEKRPGVGAGSLSRSPSASLQDVKGGGCVMEESEA